EHTFTIDTAGTGAFRLTPRGVITVYERMNGTTTDITSQFSEKDGKYVASLSPKKDATYEVSFDYQAQSRSLTAEEKVVVLQPIEVVIPAAQTVCAGDEATITLTKVSPEGTVIVWDEDNTITSGTEGESITVKAEYGEGFNHKSEYVYGFTASYAGCQELKLAAKLNVDEPLTGEIMSNAPICAGTNIEMDASSYEAETYLWMKVDSTNEMSGSRAVLRLTQPTTFLLHVTRGVCDADAVYKAEVTENPTIERVDSVDIRSRRIVVSGGTPSYTYSVDNKEYDVMDTKIDLTFTSHMAYVMDDNGCSDTMPFYMDPPAVIVPPFFSPNGDDMNEQWIPTNLKEVYPDALVTIFDRYGKKLAQYRANEEDWDGTYEGKMMPSTDYWYEIDIEEIDKQYIGHFTLIRR
ncbi:MAG: T9SS type B sorting domain-containing protein, partial [Paludibacteraceae bacterium]|nr:T9SS type B sorting domain-containing protein [Paludibacteraceae bacterium]